MEGPAVGVGFDMVESAGLPLAPGSLAADYLDGQPDYGKAHSVVAGQPVVGYFDIAGGSVDTEKQTDPGAPDQQRRFLLEGELRLVRVGKIDSGSQCLLRFENLPWPALFQRLNFPASSSNQQQREQSIPGRYHRNLFQNDSTERMPALETTTLSILPVW